MESGVYGMDLELLKSFEKGVNSFTHKLRKEIYDFINSKNLLTITIPFNTILMKNIYLLKKGNKYYYREPPMDYFSLVEDVSKLESIFSYFFENLNSRTEFRATTIPFPPHQMVENRMYISIDILV